MPFKDKFLKMGTVGKAHGIKGEVGINWQGETAMPVNSPIYLGESEKPIKVLSSREHNGRILAVLEGVDNRDAAEALKGLDVYLSRDSLPPLEEGEVFLSDLIGCSVLLADGKVLGRLDHVESAANQELWAIVTDEGKEILFPARECFIDSFDLKKRKIFINPPEGLLDIYLA